MNGLWRQARWGGNAKGREGRSQAGVGGVGGFPRPVRNHGEIRGGRGGRCPEGEGDGGIKKKGGRYGKKRKRKAQ